MFTWALAAIRSPFSNLASHGEGGADTGVDGVQDVRERFSGVNKSILPILDFLLPSDNRLFTPANVYLNWNCIQIQDSYLKSVDMLQNNTYLLSKIDYYQKNSAS